MTAALELSANEALALARRVLARHMADTDWLLWEDYPALSEAAFMRLQDEVDALAKDGMRAANECDRAEDIDSMFLLEQAEDAR